MNYLRFSSQCDVAAWKCNEQGRVVWVTWVSSRVSNKELSSRAFTDDSVELFIFRLQTLKKQHVRFDESVFEVLDQETNYGSQITASTSSS